MLRKPILVLVTLVLAAGAAGEAKVAPLFAPEPAGDLHVANELLLWQPPTSSAALWQNGEWLDLEVEIYGGGELLHRDAMSVRRPEPGKVGVVALLSRDADERRTLAGMARRGRVDLEARFLVGGLEIDRVPVASLLEAPLDLTGASLDYLALRFDATEALPALDLRRATASAQDCTDRNACLSGCQDDYWNCIDSGVCFPQIICEECDDQRLWCEQSCPPCVCSGPTVTTYTNTYQVNAYYTGYQSCVQGFSWEGKRIYWEVARVYQQDTYQVTTQCDGSSSTLLIGSTFINSYCFVNSGFSCSFEYGFSWPRC